MNEKNQRGTPRKYADYIVEFYDVDGLLLTGVGHLIDLSATGALVESALPLAPGEIVRVRLRRSRQSTIDLQASVVRRRRKTTSNSYGLQFIRK